MRKAFTYLRLAQQAEQLSSLDEVHNHVEILRVLESAPECDEEGVLDFLQHPALIICVLNLLHLDNLCLFQHLDGIEALVMLGLNQMHSAEASGTKSSADLEISEHVFALCLPNGVC